jgi:hypothetical protein
MGSFVTPLMQSQYVYELSYVRVWAWGVSTVANINRSIFLITSPAISTQ